RSTKIASAFMSPLSPSLLLLLAIGAEATNSDLEKLHLLTLGQGANLDRPDQIALDILDLAAFAADEMMVVFRVRIEPDVARLEDLFNHPFLLQPVERVVYGRARSHREFAVDHLQDLFGGRVIMPRFHVINDTPPLRRH